MHCLCSSGKLFNECCEVLLQGKQSANSPEQLMRSRYVAFATGKIGYLLQTSSVSLKKQLSEIDLKDTCEQFRFIKLEVLSASDDQVEFIASMLLQNELHILHERSLFVQEDGNWKYDSGKIFPSNVTKVLRNDVCPCGSGKKYKKCHLT